MSEPTTAGTLLADDIWNIGCAHVDDATKDRWVDLIAAIEAEAMHVRDVELRRSLGDEWGQRVLDAVTAERARITAEVGTLVTWRLGHDTDPLRALIGRAAVLRIVTGEPHE